MSEQDSAKLSEALHKVNQNSDSNYGFKSAPVPNLSGTASGGQSKG